MTRWAQALLCAVIIAVSADESAYAATEPLFVGFYLPWDAASRADMVQHAGALDIIAPMAGALDSATGTLRWQDDPSRDAALAKGPDRLKVFPIISNAHDEVWDTAAADGALLNAQVGKTVIDTLVSEAKTKGYAGYILDFENLSPNATPAYAPFLAKLRDALKPLGRELWATASLAAPPEAVRSLADASDVIVLMAYDQCWATGTPGPVAGQDWLEQALEAQLRGADASHYLIALGAYGYDWPQGQPAAVVSAPNAAQIAKAQGQTVNREPPAANPHFTYASPDGRAHAVWYLDAETFRAQRAFAQARKTRGVAVWRLGLEDPAIWTKAPPAQPGSAIAAPAAPCVALAPRPGR